MVCSPIKSLKSNTQHGANTSLNFEGSGPGYGHGAITLNLDEDNSSPWSPEKDSCSPFGEGSDERLGIIPHVCCGGGGVVTNNNLSLLELWRTESPINLDDEEQSYLDLTREYRSFDELKFKMMKNNATV